MLAARMAVQNEKHAMRPYELLPPWPIFVGGWGMGENFFS